MPKYERREDVKVTINGVYFHIYTMDDGIYIDKVEEGIPFCLVALDYSDPKIKDRALVSIYGDMDSWRPTHEEYIHNVSLSEAQRLKIKQKAG